MRGHSNKSGLVMGVLSLVSLLLASCMAHVEPRLAPEVLQERVLGPDRSLSLCEFELLNAAGSGTAALLGIAGAIYDANKAQKDAPYARELTADFNGIYEGALMGAGSFPYVPRAKLARSQDGKPMAMDALAKGNGLHACLKAKSSLLVLVGWNKKVSVATTWELTGQSGWQMTLETEAISKETHGMGPDTADPTLKPVFIELAQEGVQMFLKQLAGTGILPTMPSAAPPGTPPSSQPGFAGASTFPINCHYLGVCASPADSTAVTLTSGIVSSIDASSRIILVKGCNSSACGEPKPLVITDATSFRPEGLALAGIRAADKVLFSHRTEPDKTVALLIVKEGGEFQVK